MNSKFFPALAVLVGTTIGAGFLGIPNAISKSGFIPGIVFLILIAIFILFLKLYLGEVILRTEGSHQLTGYAEKYLGKSGKTLMFIAMIFGIYSALIAYLIGEGRSLSYVIFNNVSYAFHISLIFWVIITVLTFIGLKALKKYEKIGTFFVAVFLILIIVFFIGKINIANLSYTNPKYLFAPFGVIVFSFLAFSAMPEVRRILTNSNEKLMKKVIIWGMLIPLIVYLIFTFITIGNFGTNVPEIATLAFGRFFSLLGVITMFTAFFTQSIAIRDMFRFDFNLGRFKGWILAAFIPLIAYIIIEVFKLASFIQILSVAGVISGGLTGILILFMNSKSKELGKRDPEYSIKINWWIIILMSIIFVTAIVLEFIF